MDIKECGTTTLFLKNSTLFAEKFGLYAWELPSYFSASFFETEKGELNAKKPGKKTPIYPTVNREAKMLEWKNSLPLSQVEILYIYGIGLGYPFFLLQEWLEKNSQRRVVFIEDSEEHLGFFLQTVFLSEIIFHPQVDFLYIPTKEKEKNMVASIMQHFPKMLAEVVAAPHYAKKKKRLEKIRKEVFRKMTMVSSTYAEMVSLPFLFRNYLSSMERVASTSTVDASWKGAFRNTPAIICGAGPSLQDAMPFLQELDKKALILAGGSAITALSSQGVLPHLGVAVDPSKEELERFFQARAWELPLCNLSRLQQSVFLTGNYSSIRMKSRSEGLGAFWLDSLDLPGEVIGRKLHEESLSVTLMTLALADFLGCNPIIFCGVDLAYLDGKRYADGVLIENVSVPSNGDISAKLLLEKGQKEEPVVTAVRWIMESYVISDFVKKTKEKSFFNLSDKGLGFFNVPSLTWEIFFEKWMHKDIDITSRIHQMREMTKISSQKVLEIETQIGELQKSFLRCSDYIQLLMKESFLGKETPTMVVTMLDLQEEIAYRYFLCYVHAYIPHFFSFVEEEGMAYKKWKILLQETKKFIDAFGDVK
jgi:hypothetical protein